MGKRVSWRKRDDHYRRVQELRAMNLMASAYLADAEKNLEQARRINLDLLSGLDKEKDARKYATTVFSIATISFAECGENDDPKYCHEAVEWINKALEFENPNAPDSHYIGLKINLGLVYDKLSSGADCVPYLKKGLDIFQSVAEHTAETGYDETHASVNVMIGDFHLKLSRFEDAEANLEKAIDIFKKGLQNEYISKNQGVREETEQKLRTAESELAARKNIST
jgi:tetratricopeptide (TPR) repeat protein